MDKIAIVGCGFAGTMTAVHLIKKAKFPFELVMIGDRDSFNKGIAYNPYSKKQLLNVPAARMSAFQDKPDHFLNWISRQEPYSGIDKELVANAYHPRHLYGRYLNEIWRDIILSPESIKVRITIIGSLVDNLDISGNNIVLTLENRETITARYCILATGNFMPGNPDIPNTQFFNNPNYFRNPWQIDAVKNHDNQLPVMILGNGLTMADTILGLLENGFSNKIYTLSPHGFTTLPHLHHGLGYTAIREELLSRQDLAGLVRIVHKHIRVAKELGYSAEPIIDSIRPQTQQLWKNMIPREKRMFMARLRHFWDSARHRIPMHIYDFLRQLRDSGQLTQYAGRLIDISSGQNGTPTVIFSEAGQKTTKELQVSAVINCTGPSTDPMKADNNYLKNCLVKGIVVQDDLKLGILADPVSFEVINSRHERHENIFALGSLLKGVLWESTAVKELREQAEMVAGGLVSMMEGQSGS